jgi:hypothetical protein
MALGDLTKELARQALGNPAKDVLDALRPADLSRISENVKSEKPVASGPVDSVCAAILGQIQAMQKALKEDQELVVLFSSGTETVRVLEFYAPSWHVMVLTGIDTNKNVTRVISPVASLQLICKVMTVPPPAKPTRVGVIVPKPKPE